MLDDATEHALVLIDELGKGTEVKAGTAIAGAMLERLHDSHCRGAFATWVNSPHCKAPYSSTSECFAGLLEIVDISIKASPEPAMKLHAFRKLVCGSEATWVVLALCLCTARISKDHLPENEPHPAHWFVTG